MDYLVFQWIHQWVGRSGGLDGVMILLAQWLTPLLIIIFVVVGIEQLWRARKLPLPLAALIAGFLAWLIQYSISLAFFFHRPFALLRFNPLISHNPLDSSFPSGHASFLFGMAFFVLIAQKGTELRMNANITNKKFAIRTNSPFGFLLVIVALLVSVARVYAGVHWPLDIVGGICVGLLSACLVYSTLQRWRASRLHHAPKIIRW